MNDYFVAVWAALAGGLAVLGLLTALDVIAGIIVALKKHQFQWQCIGDFMSTDGIKIFAWVAVTMIVLIPEKLIPGGYVIPVVKEVFYLFAFASIMGSFLKSLADLGVMPQFFQKVGVSDKDTG